MIAFRDALRIHLAAMTAGRSDFEDSLTLIDRYFEYAPTAFDNGPVKNAAGVNEGACRVFALAQIGGLTEQATLSCFGRHYSAVIDDPGGSNHVNIRQFIGTGWSGIRFHGQPLRFRESRAHEKSAGNAAPKAQLTPSEEPSNAPSTGLSTNNGDAN